ncbi:MAG: cytochrome c biogenesis protein CcsA [Armatimonadota bacterium]|nr:cytochrome c biogenesis protein CcsA [Armatimonadota bacterium]MDR7451447.1 cytochrome c biogenesis protein CcsA [Armatimonadota bacterium]MDR7466403.1 cytochrome c biogenesis protein CcsA [Armatimonadota bacterium]MDR7493125.1 cytochrome c biogenesis protein CcsA [Armatimonadota bacterium]MDR7498118.1 cytochrome c biogenesis protein CcsA [Armatimonadota bacterium]
MAVPAIREVRSASPGFDWREGLVWVGALLGGFGMYMAILFAPEEATMSHAQRIFYVHVPAAWVGFLAFAVVFVASAAFLWTRRRAFDLAAHASTEIGVVFTTLAIISGAVWGKAVWGTWWTWDPRLTTTFMLWFIYTVSLMVRAYGGPSGQSARFAAVLGVVGFLDIPLIHLSVLWWRSLHPLPVVLRTEGFGTGLPPQMLWALLTNVAAFTVLYILLFSIRRAQLAAQDALSAQQEQGRRTRPTAEAAKEGWR